MLMTKDKKVVIQVHEQDGSTVSVEIDDHFIEFYKKETGRSKVSADLLAKFIDNLVFLHTSPS